MSKHLHTLYPFASYPLLTDGRSILFELLDETIVKADHSKQIVFREIIHEFCQKIEFSEQLLAKRFYPLGKKHHIVVDPHHQFGQPVINNTNLLAETINELHEAGEKNHFIAKLYNISEEEVKDAVKLFHSNYAA